MKLAKKVSVRTGKWLALCLVWMAAGWFALAQGFSTTTVQGTVYLANGKPGSGTLQVSWPSFTTAINQAVTAGRTTVAIGTDGYVSMSLAPNVGATPAGLYYTAVYHLSDGTTSTEYWVVPAAAQASLGQVRAQVMPAAQAVQAVSKGYVDQSIQELTQSLLTAGGGSLTGPLYLNGDPQMPTQAADKHYVDTLFGQAVPITGGTMSGPLTSVKLGAVYQADQFPGSDFGSKLQSCINELDPTYGGTCDARNFAGNLSMVSNLNIATANVTVQLPCATIATSNQVIVAAGTRNVTLHGCALRGASASSGSQGGTVLLYSGTGAMVQVGDPAYVSDTSGFHMDNAVINTTPSSAPTAQAIAAYRTQDLDLQSLYLLGNSNQTGLTLDGTGNYTGGSFQDDKIDGFGTALNAIGHQVANPATMDWMNASTFVRLHIACPTSGGAPISGTYGINLQQGDGNTFTGGDVEGCSTALHLGPNGQNNTIIGLRNENSTSQVVADAGSSYNNWMTGGTMFTGKLIDNGTRNSFLDTFHRSFNGLNGDWYGSQQDATLTNYYRIGIGAGNERGLLNRYQTDSGYRWTTGLSDATAGEQFYQVLDELNNVYRLSIGQYNTGQSSANNQTVINAAGTGAVVLNGSTNAGTGGVVFGSGGASGSTVATINNVGNAQFNGTLQVGGPSTFNNSTSIKNQADAEIDTFLWAGATTSQKESLTYKDWNGINQWYMVKDAGNNWALNSAIGGLDSFKAYQSTSSGDTYVNASNATGHIRLNYETGSGAETDIYSGSSAGLVAAFLGTTAIKFPGLAAASGHNCLQIDASGYISNSGSGCGTGGGSGVVNAGTAGQIAYYAGNGTAVAGTSAVAVIAGGTGANTAAAALANLGAQSALPGVTADGGTGINVVGNVATGGSMTSTSINNLANAAHYVAGASGNVTNGLNAYIAAQIAANARGTLWIDPTVASGSPTSAWTSNTRIEDARGNSIYYYNGLVTTSLMNGLMWGAWEDQTASNTTYNGFSNVWDYYSSLRGGSYWYPWGPTGAGSGTKTDYVNHAIHSNFNTIGQKTGLQIVSWSTANGETMPLAINTNDAGGQGLPGAEAAEMIRIQAQQMSSGTSVSGGLVNGTITAITGSGPYVVTFAATNDLNTVGERCCFRDLGTVYSTGTIASISNASNTPVTGVTTVTVTGSGTAWSTLGIGNHTTFNSTTNSQGFMVTATNLCLTISAAQHDGYDVVIPIASIVNDTSLTVLPVDTSIGQTGWFAGWPTSGSYKITGCAYPSSTSYPQNATTGSGSFTTLDASGLTSGHSIDQSLAYNTDFLGMQMVMQHHIGRSGAGGGINIMNNGTAGSPSFGSAIAISGLFTNGISIQQSGQPSGVIPYGIFNWADPTTAWWNSNVVSAVSTNVFQFRDDTSATLNALTFNRNHTAANYGIGFFGNANISPSGNITNAGTITSTGNISSTGGNVSGVAGGFGPYNNQALCSEFQSSCISNWVTVGIAGPTITANTTDIADGFGGNTVQKFVAPSGMTAGQATGQQQTTTVTMSPGTNYSLSMYFAGAVGGEVVALALSTNGSDPHCVPGAGGGQIPSSLTLTTSLKQYSITCSPNVSDTAVLRWTVIAQTGNLQPTVYTWMSQFSTNSATTGTPMVTTTTAISGTGCFSVGTVCGAGITPVTITGNLPMSQVTGGSVSSSPVCPNGAGGTLTTVGCAGGTSTSLPVHFSVVTTSTPSSTATTRHLVASYTIPSGLTSNTIINFEAYGYAKTGNTGNCVLYAAYGSTTPGDGGGTAFINTNSAAANQGMRIQGFIQYANSTSAQFSGGVATVVSSSNTPNVTQTSFNTASPTYLSLEFTGAAGDTCYLVSVQGSYVQQ